MTPLFPQRIFDIKIISPAQLIDELATPRLPRYRRVHNFRTSCGLVSTKPGIIVSLGDTPYSFSSNAFNADFPENPVLSQNVHTFEAFDIFQNNLSLDNHSQLPNLDLVQDDDLLLTVPELAAPDETGTGQFTSERLYLRYESDIDPQNDTSTIL
ncbi:uncharacterized protein Y057_8933 [Fusarium fujikuroi]|nr:uncharacterized protein Y057_8933 [Fusarium fujikuroi]